MRYEYNCSEMDVKARLDARYSKNHKPSFYQKIIHDSAIRVVKKLMNNPCDVTVTYLGNSTKGSRAYQER